MKPCCHLSRIDAALHGKSICPTCGDEWLVEASPKPPPEPVQLRGIQSWEPPTTPPPKINPATGFTAIPAPHERPRYGYVVDELWAYRDAEAAAHGSSNWLRGAIVGPVDKDAAVVVGDGNRGSKPLGRAKPPDPPPAPSAKTRTRILALDADTRRTAEAVMDDQIGWRDGPIELQGVPLLQWPLEARIGVALASQEDLLKWSQRVLARDAWPARADAADQGRVALEALAEAWR